MSIVSIPADPTPGAAPSPWALNGNDLYPDSTSYIVGIGTDNPDTLLHLKAADGTPKIKLEGTDYDYTIEVDANHGGTQNSSLLRFESDTHFAGNEIEFKNGSSNANSTISMHLTALGSSTLYFYDGDLTSNGKVKTALTTNFTTDRFYLYGEDGYAGGMLTMDFSQLNDTRFGFGYGNEALSNAVRLAIKHTSSPQLLLEDGTSSTTFQHEDNSSSPRVTLNQALRLSHASNAHLTLDDLEASNNNPITLTNATGTGLTFTATNGDGSGNSALNYKFVNDRSSGGSSTIQAIGDTATGLYLTSGSQGIKIDQSTADRRVRFRDYAAGNAGGCFNMEYNDSGSGTAQNYFSFGYGNTAHPYDSRLNIKDTALPQLGLTDGSETTTMKVTSDALTVHQDGAFDFKIDTNAGGNNTNLRFSEGGVVKAGLVHRGADEARLVQWYGFNQNEITAASGASTTISATYSGNVIACDTTSNAITATLPAVARYAGSVVYVIDSKGNAGATGRAITIAVQTGEKLDGVLNGTATISSNNGFSVLVCTADGWFQVA